MNTATAIATPAPSRSESELRAIADAMVSAEVHAYEKFIRDRMDAFHAERGGEWNDAFLAFHEDADGEEAAIADWHSEDGESGVFQTIEQFWELHNGIYETLNTADVDAVIDMTCARMNDREYYRMAGTLAMDDMHAEEEAAA